MEKKKKKIIISTIVASVFLLVLIVGATYAYFQSSNIASGSTNLDTTTEAIGSVIVVNPTENLYLKLSAADMQQAKVGTSYYATATNSNASSIYSKETEYNSIANMKVIGGTAGTKHKCTFNIDITKPEGIQEGDMNISFKNDNLIRATINGVKFNEDIDLYGSSSTYQVTFVADGSHTEGYDIISTSIKLNNTNSDQNHIAGKNLGVSISISELDCKVGGDELLAAGLYDENGMLTYTWEELLSKPVPYEVYELTEDYEFITKTLEAPILKIDENGVLSPQIDETTSSRPTSSYLKGTLVLGDSVLEIDEWAFSDSTLKSVVLSDSVIKIGDRAFVATPLERIVFGNSIESIGTGAFEDTLITNVKIPDSVKVIGEMAFSYSNLKSVSLGKSLETIGESAFSGTKIKSIEFPDNVKTIGCGAFSDSTLKTINLGFSIEKIGCQAFMNTQITNIQIPDSVKQIEESAFRSTPLENVYFGDSLETISESAFANTKLTSINIPNSVKTIGSQAFANTKLTSVNIPESVSTIGLEAFSSPDLQTIKVDTSNLVYDSRNNCNAMIETATNKVVLASANTILPNNVIAIGESAFKNLELEKLVIPNSISSIHKKAFTNAMIKKLEIDMETIPSDVFNLASITKLKFGSNVKTISYNAFNKTSITELILPSNIETIETSFPNTITSLEIGMENFPMYIGSSNIKKLKINDSVKSIENWILADYTELESIIVDENNLNFISYDNSLIDLSTGTLIRASVNTTKISPDVIIIGANAFYFNEKITNIKIPEKVTTIGSFAFSGCVNLDTVVLPVSLKSIEFGAFEGTNLTTINYKGSQSDWNLIEFGPAWDDGTSENKQINYNYTG